MTRSRQTADWGSRAGLAKIVPSSVAVGSGTGSADSLGNVTFTGCSSVSLNGVFTSKYENYRILITGGTSSSASWANIRMRVSGTDNSNSTYRFRAYVGNYGGPGTDDTSRYGTAETSWPVQFFSTSRNNASYDFYSPFLSQQTQFTANHSMDVSNGYTIFASGLFAADTSFDGFTLTSGSGTITGKISVYGYTN
jgi:hypothetical protein